MDLQLVYGWLMLQHLAPLLPDAVFVPLEDVLAGARPWRFPLYSPDLASDDRRMHSPPLQARVLGGC